MRFHSPLDDIWNSKVKTRILRHLSQSGYGITGRQLAESVGYSHTQTMTALGELESQGLVNRQHAGRAHLFTIVDENIIVSEVLLPAFDLERNLLNLLADIFYDSMRPELTSIILFGSVARSEETDASDVDLLLVLRKGTNLERAEEEAFEIAFKAHDRFGCHVQTILVTKDEYDRKLKRKQGFWRDLPTEGRKLLSRDERLK